MKRASVVGILGLAWFAGLGGCNGKEEKRLSGAGATFIYPMMSKWASEYQKAKGIKINYQSIAPAAASSR